MLRLLVATLVFVLPGLLSAQGILSGFMQGSGNAAVSVAYSTESFDEYWNGETLVNNPQLGTIQTVSTNLYVSMGVTSWADIVVNIPWVSASSSAGLWETISGLQNYSVYARVRPLQIEINNTTKLDVMAGVGVNGALSNYPNDSPVTIGHGNRSFDGKFILQARNTDLDLFAMAAGGYVANAAVQIDRGFDVVVPDRIETTFRVGWTGPVYVDAWVHNMISQSGTDLGAGVPFPTNKIDFLKVGGTVAYQLPMLKELSVYGGVASVVAGRNIGKSFGLRVGLTYNLALWNSNSN